MIFLHPGLGGGAVVRVYLEKTTILNDTCTLVFAATLLTTARTWKQAGCPSTDELECI